MKKKGGGTSKMTRTFTKLIKLHFFFCSRFFFRPPTMATSSRRFWCARPKVKPPSWFLRVQIDKFSEKKNFFFFSGEGDSNSVPSHIYLPLLNHPSPDYCKSVEARPPRRAVVAFLCPTFFSILRHSRSNTIFIFVFYLRTKQNWIDWFNCTFLNIYQWFLCCVFNVVASWSLLCSVCVMPSVSLVCI